MFLFKENILVEEHADVLEGLVTTKEVNFICVSEHSGVHSNEKAKKLA